ncbi:hypothetical protein HED49_19640 [Ochrobactrum daejeonense]|nr:hypothetical protein [Brucella daejeonensis]
MEKDIPVFLDELSIDVNPKALKTTFERLTSSLITYPKKHQYILFIRQPLKWGTHQLHFGQTDSQWNYPSEGISFFSFRLAG